MIHPFHKFNLLNEALVSAGTGEPVGEFEITKKEDASVKNIKLSYNQLRAIIGGEKYSLIKPVDNIAKELLNRSDKDTSEIKTKPKPIPTEAPSAISKRLEDEDYKVPTKTYEVPTRTKRDKEDKLNKMYDEYLKSVNSIKKLSAANNLSTFKAITWPESSSPSNLLSELKKLNIKFDALDERDLVKMNVDFGSSNTIMFFVNLNKLPIDIFENSLVKKYLTQRTIDFLMFIVDLDELESVGGDIDSRGVVTSCLFNTIGLHENLLDNWFDTLFSSYGYEIAPDIVRQETRSSGNPKFILVAEDTRDRQWPDTLESERDLSRQIAELCTPTVIDYLELDLKKIQTIYRLDSFINNLFGKKS